MSLGRRSIVFMAFPKESVIPERSNITGFKESILKGKVCSYHNSSEILRLDIGLPPRPF